ncbi:uncharacterized protein LOC112591547 [Melanaphis sacchari]|uniref:uncharacterized protein LOC112591547 n=1 Tax=Melanaphis sacchari TaxID=742174 RepID=UPI000DC158B7|nr:uncharacterized protein LOC112591547 [Melanaphis sacchari]
MDEMSLKKLISYNSQNDQFSGYEDFGIDHEFVDMKICDQALVVMIKGIVKPWKQIVGYFFSKGPVSGFRLKNIITNVINKVRDAGFIPKVIICDQGTNNIDLADFYNLDKNKKPRLAPRLNKIHMDLPPFSPMRVCLATQTLSHSVSSGMMTLISMNEMKSSAMHTARFIELFDNLFDVFNSITHSEAKILRKPLTKTSDHWNFLNEAKQVLGKLKVHNRTGKLPPYFLLTRRLTQDCVENVFSVVRSKGGNNVTPDATKFHSAIRMCMCNTLLEPSQSGNCESECDAVQFLTKCSELNKIKIQLKVIGDPNDDEYSDKEDCLNLHLSSMNIANIQMENHEACAIGYVAGWVCSKLIHQECVDKLAVKKQNNPQVNLENTHIEMKSTFLNPTQLIEFEFNMSKPVLKSSINYMVAPALENSFNLRLSLQNVNASATG